MDPLSISVNAVGLAIFAGKFVQSVGAFVTDTKEVPDTINEFYETIRTFHVALQNISEVLKCRPRQFPFEKDHHNNISQILRSCEGALQRLDNQLPDLPDDVSTFDKIRMNLSMSLKKESITQIINHINSYTQILQLSLITLSLGSLWGTQKSQDKIQAEIRHLTTSIRSANLIQPRNEAHSSVPPGLPGEENLSPDPDLALVQEIKEWRTSADDVAAAVSLWDPDQASLDARRTIPDSGVDVGSSTVAEIEFEDFDPEPQLVDYSSRDILQQQMEENQKIVSQLISCGIFLKAASFQRRGISWKAELWEAHQVPFPWDEEADMKEALADILLSSDTVDGTIEAKEILTTLLREQIARLSSRKECFTENDGLPLGPETQERRCRLYHKLGELYMHHNNISTARRCFQRAFEGRRKGNAIPSSEALETCNLLIKCFQLDQAFVEAAAHIQWRDEQLRLHPGMLPQSRLSISTQGSLNFAPREEKPYSTALEKQEQSSLDYEHTETTGLSTAFAWCKSRDFDVDTPEFSFEVCDSLRGTSPLHLVVLDEALDVFHQIVDHVVTFEHRDDNFATPLLLAAGTRNKITTEVLLERGAKVNVCDRLGMSPLHRCQSDKGGVQVAELLLQYNKNGLHYASPSFRPRPDLLNLADTAGKSALYMACEKRNKRMVRFLLDQGANADLTEKYGKTPLYMACERGDEAIVRCLLERGASPNIQGPGMQTPLLIAIEAPTRMNVKISIIEALLAHGADPHLSDAIEQTAFSAARKAGFGSEIRRLLNLNQVEPRRVTSISSITTTVSGRSKSGSGSPFGTSLTSPGMLRPREDSSASRISASKR